jgi:hypothetical protein
MDELEEIHEQIGGAHAGDSTKQHVRKRSQHVLAPRAPKKYHERIKPDFLKGRGKFDWWRPRR